MAQKGKVQFDDNIQPLTRTYILSALDSLSSQTLSTIEKKELNFYLQEYSIVKDSTDIKPTFFKKDLNGRFRSFITKKNDFILTSDPILSAARTSGEYSFTQTTNGFQLWGTAGKNFGFQFYARDVFESGNKIDKRVFTPATGMVLQSDSAKKKSQNFTELRAALTYSFKKGLISVGQDYLLWGYGYNGRMILSDKAPVYPYIRFDYQLFKWMKFNYTHAFLHSNIIDSSRTYGFGNPAFGGQRIMYVPKYMASHSLQITPSKGLDISFGENMVYADRLDVGFLIPVMFFKVYDNMRSSGSISAGGNGQLFVQVSSRNQVKNTHLYAGIFADEIKVAKMFSKKESRNQIGFNAGISVTDVLIPYLTFNAEYARINPFVYRNLNPAENYTNHDYVMGHWMGNNADQTIIGLQYTPIARLKLQIDYQFVRKGGAGTIDQQYFAKPQPDFLFDKQFTREAILGKLSYEFTHQLYFFSSFQSAKVVRTTGTSAENAFSAGIFYGR